MLYLVAEQPSKQNTLIADTTLQNQARSQDFRFFGEKCIFMGERFLFFSCSKQIFLSTTKFWKAQEKYGGNCPRLPHHVCSPGQNRRHSLFHCVSSRLCRGIGHSENLFLIYNMNNICRLRKLIINNFLQIPIIGS